MSEEAVTDDVSEKDDRGQWFVLHVRSGFEKKVCESIKNKIRLSDQVSVYDAIVPMQIVADFSKGEKTSSRQKLYPGYIWVRMDLYLDEECREINEAAWNLVKGVQGVLGFLGGKSGKTKEDERVYPIPLTAEEVEPVLNVPDDQLTAKTPLKYTFTVGEVLRIKDGAFEGSEGVVQEIDNERGKIKLMVSMFGRSTPVELEFWQVERID